MRSLLLRKSRNKVFLTQTLTCASCGRVLAIMIHVNMVCLSQSPSPTALAPPEVILQRLYKNLVTPTQPVTLLNKALATAEGKFSLNSVSHYISMCITCNEHVKAFFRMDLFCRQVYVLFS